MKISRCALRSHSPVFKFLLTDVETSVDHQRKSFPTQLFIDSKVYEDRHLLFCCAALSFDLLALLNESNNGIIIKVWMVNSMEFEILFRLRLYYYDVDGEAHEIPADEDVSRRCRLAHK